ncbi:MAG: hypothetical protein DRP85_02530 [Candidatus Makaraimicrobium thalassicum]|nr:MAG: hypothetical protein DRP85_02530 [Candidatus Omnitrophota bacterium]
MKKSLVVGILKESEDRGERRAPLTPSDVRWLVEKGIEVEVVSSDFRIFKDNDYFKAGARIVKRIKKASFLVGVKAPDPADILSGKIYMIFSHATKGQNNNIHLLKEFLRKDVTMVDYEKITDRNGKRLVYFGRFAGICGLVDSLHYYGKKMKNRGIKTPFLQLKPCWKYGSIEDLKRAVERAGKRVREEGFPGKLTPFITGIIGHGNVSCGIQEILGLMNTVEVHPGEIKRFVRQKRYDNKKIYMMVFKKEERLRSMKGKKFCPEEYFKHPDMFESNLDRYIPKLNMLMNAGYWNVSYPKLVTRDMIKDLYKKKDFRLEFIADISCDIDGAVELTYRTTTRKKPTYTYAPVKDIYRDGYKDRGITLLAVDNLPTELPKDSSDSFSKLIRGYVYKIAAHGTVDIGRHIAIPREIRGAVVTQNAELMKHYQYLKKDFG